MSARSFTRAPTHWAILVYVPASSLSLPVPVSFPSRSVSPSALQLGRCPHYLSVSLGLPVALFLSLSLRLSLPSSLSLCISLSILHLTVYNVPSFGLHLSTCVLPVLPSHFPSHFRPVCLSTCVFLSISPNYLYPTLPLSLSLSVHLSVSTSLSPCPCFIS